MLDGDSRIFIEMSREIVPGNGIMQLHIADLRKTCTITFAVPFHFASFFRRSDFLTNSESAFLLRSKDRGVRADFKIASI